MSFITELPKSENARIHRNRFIPEETHTVYQKEIPNKQALNSNSLNDRQNFVHELPQKNQIHHKTEQNSNKQPKTIFSPDILRKKIKSQGKPSSSKKKPRKNHKSQQSNKNGISLSENKIHTNISNYEQLFDMNQIEIIMQQRKERVKKVCGVYGYGPYAKKVEQKIKMPPVPHYSIFFIDR